jgi:hypothetical protein
MKKVIIESLSSEQMEKIGVEQWPIWEKEISEFDWDYDTDEQCYIIDGEVHVDTTEGSFHIKPGDFVTFKKGLRCNWKITKSIRKHYRFL